LLLEALVQARDGQDPSHADLTGWFVQSDEMPLRAGLLLVREF
jgi:hypothetical protein